MFIFVLSSSWKYNSAITQFRKNEPFFISQTEFLRRIGYHSHYATIAEQKHQMLFIKKNWKNWDMFLLIKKKMVTPALSTAVSYLKKMHSTDRKAHARFGYESKTHLFEL